MESRGLTLRSKSRRPRPQISAPKPISGPLPPNNTSPSPSTSTSTSAVSKPAVPVHGTLSSSAAKDATSDLVKRRYSARFNQVPDFDGVPPVPGLPPLPATYGGLSPPETSRRPSTESPGPPQVDLNALRDPSLPVDKYVANLLANASEEEIEEYQRSLRKVKNRTSTDLQQNVYQNRTQFIKISKEAEKLKGEMRTLRTLMAELTTALGQTTVGTTPNPMSPMPDERLSKRHANRSSVANLESMWNVQLQTLWKTVEGSQKFLPVVPGRHIVMESGHWVELDSATWKPRRPVHIVLLNDHLLVAAKKRKRVDQSSHRGPVPTKLVAEECWPLQDVDMIDLGANLGAGVAREEAEDRGITNAINVRVGGKPFTYRHDKRDSSAKSDLLATFRKTVEDLRRTLRSETEAAGKAAPESMGYRGVRHPSYSPQPDRSDIMDNVRDKPELRIDVDGKQQNLRWVEGQVDELDIDIALQRFEDAVAHIERLRKLARGLKGNAVAQDVITTKVDERAATLAEVLLRELVDTHSFPQATKTKSTWLMRLGFEDQAREAYLKARSDIVSKRIRACVFEGDLPMYIFQISYVYFTLIKNTISIYQQCFPPVMSSASIKWAKHHLDGFNALLTRQLSSVQRGTTVYQKCLDIVHDHANMLTEVGVDFTDLVAKGLEVEDLAERPQMTRSESLISGLAEAAAAASPVI
ncbi:exocyst subunit EXO84 [Aspergillus homomorphus CBS 101889]|uniref:Exocyst complex component EXO84 n=1 Tax=Aspergillus homomorphus (strain CBS 101889) TaxID=1450537 RepID=A0A395IA67_ASPHC|nr:exocyst complex component Exo84 [Aspergillus homomorphus CBS 101889]RAL17057.1 exocyst complex component Exo84 [Aspergillus homomorphus CBS 101889]